MDVFLQSSDGFVNGMREYVAVCAVLTGLVFGELDVFPGLTPWAGMLCLFKAMLNQYFLAVTTKEDRVGISVVMRIASGTAAGLAGSVIGGGLLEMLVYYGIEGFSVYRYYFAIILAVLLAFFLVIKKMQPKERNNEKFSN